MIRFVQTVGVFFSVEGSALPSQSIGQESCLP